MLIQACVIPLLLIDTSPYAVFENLHNFKNGQSSLDRLLSVYADRSFDAFGQYHEAPDCFRV